jgi:hypothetical protein
MRKPNYWLHRVNAILLFGVWMAALLFIFETPACIHPIGHVIGCVIAIGLPTWLFAWLDA